MISREIQNKSVPQAKARYKITKYMLLFMNFKASVVSFHILFVRRIYVIFGKFLEDICLNFSEQKK